MNRYIITFPSVTKASLAQDRLRGAGYFSTVGKSPAGLLQTCGYAVYLDVRNIDQVMDFLHQAGVEYSGIYQMQQNGYRKIK